MLWTFGRLPNATTLRCTDCGSYGAAGGTRRSCGWVDPTYDAPKPSKLSKAELARRLAEPCVPSSDISTLRTADEVLGEE